MPTCAFASCASVAFCSLPGGCIRDRFQPADPKASDLKKNARALNGVLPGRTNRDPRFIKRKRKELTR